MKTQKQFVISSMFETLKILGMCFILIALFAPTAHAETVVVDPGEVGTEAKNFYFSSDRGTLIDILWSDNKTLEWEAGTHVFSVVGSPPGLLYVGILLDADGKGIPGTELIGKAPTLGGDDIQFLGIIDLPEMTVFSGIRFSSSYSSNVELSWNWNPADRPVVGDGGQPPAEEKFTIGGNATGVQGSGLVLQNNGGDDLPVPQDGVGAFATPLSPGSSYNVTVFTQPTDPAQTCSVQNGSGTVPSEDVTDVVISCAELVVGNINMLAAENDTLPDGTFLKQIILDGRVGINIYGNVAFGGRDGDSTVAVFTQKGLVAKEKGTLTDGTFVDDISPFGEVAIGAGQSGDRVAFHGRSSKDKAVFTQAGVVAKEGKRLPDGTLVKEIKDSGKVAINDLDQVAFHGKVEIGGGLFDKEILNAVFTSRGMVVHEGSELSDLTIVQAIDETGGVAINDLGGVAFHGDAVDADTGSDAVEAVFNDDRLVAKREGVLPDGTIVSDIDENGGVAINIFGLVAFHGDVVDLDKGTDAVRAVFIQGVDEGQVIKQGETLPDGTVLEEITEAGGVAINFFGDVVFHGRTDGVEAVFTQNGLVAKEGDSLSDDSILEDIHPNGGVAINFNGQVAFHGKTGDNDAVFVGVAPE